MTPQDIGKIVTDAEGAGLLAAAPQRTYKGAMRYELGYVTAGLHPCVDEAHKAVQWWLNDIANKQALLRRWVSLLGASGCGKTHLALAARDTLKAQGRRVRYRRWGDALGQMLDGDWELMPYLINSPILILDDIGAEYAGSPRMNQLNAAKLLELLEGRLGKWTLLTSNLNEEHIAERLDVRIASRLYRGQNVLVDMTEADDFGQIVYDARKLRVQHQSRKR